MVFNLFKKNKGKIYAPLNGTIQPLAEVPDPVFSGKMMGEGIAIEPSEGKVYAPADGEIIQVAPTNHAVGILTEDGTEVLIHVGLNTVNLKGEGFQMHTKMDQQVKKGDLLLEFDLDYIREHAPSIVTPIVITNSHNSNKTYDVTHEKVAVQGESVLIQVK